MNALYDALHERRNRAIGVRETYTIMEIGLQAWVVQHPDEPERCYLVDMIRHHCSCPDFVCTTNGLGMDCKHILAVYPLWEAMTGLRRSAFLKNDQTAIGERNLQADFSRQMAEFARCDDPFERI